MALIYLDTPTVQQHVLSPPIATLRYPSYRVMAELVCHLIAKVDQGLLERPLTNADHHEAAAPLPPPMIPDNYEAASTRCFIAKAFQQCVTAHTGWEWVNESRERRPKWGYVSKLPGSKMTLTFDSRLGGKASGMVSECCRQHDAD